MGTRWSRPACVGLRSTVIETFLRCASKGDCNSDLYRGGVFVMLKVVVPSFALVLASVVALSAAEKSSEIQSGLELGSFAPAFDVLDITGPKKGTELCYRCRYGSRPVVNI